MRFAAAGKFSANDYASAGRSAAQSLVQSFAAARQNAPNWTNLAKVSMGTRSAERQTAMKAEADVATAGVRAFGNVKSNQIKGAYDLAAVKTKIGAQKSRMAGRVAGLGGFKMPRKKKFVPAFSQEHIEKVKGTRQPVPEVGDYNAGTTQPSEIKYYDPQGHVNQTSTAGNAAADYLSSDNQNAGKGPAPTSPTSAGGTFTIPEQGDGAWSRLSRVIRFGEGTQGDAGYNTQFTGTQFNDLSRHPRQIRSGNGLSSDAAGAYQFLSTTWDEAKNALNLPDFSPASQEKAGRFLTQRRGVNPDQPITTLDEFRTVMDKLAPEWASLPYSGVSPSGHGRGSSYYGQGGKNINELWNLYRS